MNIVYKMNEEKTQVHIVKVLYADNSQPQEKLRTKEWLLKVSEYIMPEGAEEEKKSSSHSSL